MTERDELASVIRLATDLDHRRMRQIENQRIIIGRLLKPEESINRAAEILAEQAKEMSIWRIRYEEICKSAEKEKILNVEERFPLPDERL